MTWSGGAAGFGPVEVGARRRRRRRTRTDPGGLTVWERRVIVLSLVGGMWLSVVAAVYLHVRGLKVPTEIYLTGTACMIALIRRLPEESPRGVRRRRSISDVHGPNGGK